MVRSISDAGTSLEVVLPIRIADILVLDLDGGACRCWVIWRKEKASTFDSPIMDKS